MQYAELKYILRNKTNKWVVPLGARRLQGLLDQGVPLTSIADIAGASVRQVTVCRDLIASYRSTKPGRPFSPDQILSPLVEEINGLWNAGATSLSIADRYGVTRGRLLAFMSRERKRDPDMFIKRLGTKHQIKRRIHGQASADIDASNDIRALQELRVEGVKYAALMRLFGISLSSARRIVSHGKPLSDDDIQGMEEFASKHMAFLSKARRLFDAGAHPHEIAQHYNMSATEMLTLIARARQATRGAWFEPRNSNKWSQSASD